MKKNEHTHQPLFDLIDALSINDNEIIISSSWEDHTLRGEGCEFESNMKTGYLEEILLL